LIWITYITAGKPLAEHIIGNIAARGLELDARERQLLTIARASPTRLRRADERR
jgi:hypothetical protein